MEAGKFYEQMRGVAHGTWRSEHAQKLIGTVWALALQGRPDAELAVWLDGWGILQGPDCFGFLRALPVLVEIVRLPAAIAEPWLVKVHERVKICFSVCR